MNTHREDNPCCHFHPRVVVIGVCPLCLNEKLLILAAKKGHLPSARVANRTQGNGITHRKAPISLPNIFAMGSFLNRLEFRHRKSDNYSDHDASASQEDSFISIKFEGNGVASWEKGTKVSVEHCSKSLNHGFNQETNKPGNFKDSKESKSVIEHGKPCASLRWKKRIGHLFQLIRWRSRSNKGNVCHVGGKVEGVKVRRGWIRALTKRRTKE